MKKAIPFLLFSIFLLTVAQFFLGWNFCNSFHPDFHMNAFNLSLKVDDLTHSDSNTPLVFVRIFHNKYLVFAIELFHRLSLFLNPVFLFQLVSPLGLVFLGYGVIQMLRREKEKLYARAAVAFLFASLLIECLFAPALPFIVKYFLFDGLVLAISFYGLYRYTKKLTKSKILFFVAMSLLSLVWFIVFSPEVGQFCIR